MPKFKTLIDKNTTKEALFLYEVLGGKLNNTLPPNEQTIQQRVVRPKQKGYTCFYYASRILTHRVGKHPDLQSTPERKTEIMLSKARKESTESKLFDHACNLLLDYAVQIDQNNNNNIIRWAEKKVKCIDGSEAEKKEFVSAVKDFANARDKNRSLLFRDYIAARREEEVQERAIKKLTIMGVNFEQEIKKYQGEFRQEFDRITNIHHSDKDFNLIMSNMMEVNAQLALEQFRPVAWSTQTSFEHLTTLLKDHGPLLASGLYGKNYYQSDIIHSLALGKAELSGGKTVDLKAQYWESNERIEHGNMAHVIVVIGFHVKGNTQLVYFIDPSDISSPDQPSTLYAMSYKAFCLYSSTINVIDCIQSHGMIGSLYAGPGESANPALRVKY